MDSSFSVARICGTTIFDVLGQNADDVICVINYIIQKSAGNAQNTPKLRDEGVNNNGTYFDRNGVKHVRVNMITATGGWY